MSSKITIFDLNKAKAEGKRMAAISCYDYLTAKAISQTDIPVILVGDSAAQLFLGHDSTLPATMDFMVTITAAVRRGAPNVCLVADMPFLSYQVSTGDAVKNAGRFGIEAGAQIIKIEATAAQLNIIKAVSDAGMAVMAHIGIKPQTIAKTGKYIAEATTAESAAQLVDLAGKMVDTGAVSILLEGVASDVARIITESVDVPTIGIGAGPHCDGQILVAPDILGLLSGPKPKFSKSWANLESTTKDAFEAYANDVTEGKYPAKEHCYNMKSGEIDKLRQILKLE